MCSSCDIKDELKKRVLVLDGAMGTMIQRLRLNEQDYRGKRFYGHPVNIQGCIDVLNLTKPEAVEAIHSSYLEAGADIIETNTFSSQVISMAEYQLEDYAAEMARAGVEIARRAVKKYIQLHPGSRKWVAATMGPTAKSLAMSATSGDDPKAIDWAELESAFFSQAVAYLEGGADIILIETVFDTLNAKAAAMAVRRAMDKVGREVPVMVSFTLTEQGRTLSGQTIDAAVASISHLNPLSVGLNCGFGASQLIPYIESMQSLPYAISFHPNAGHPDELGEYRETPETMVAALGGLLEAGMLNIVGGCCGTSPAHIMVIAEEAKRGVPREIPVSDGVLVLSGLNAIRLPSEGGPLTIVGERCNVAGSRKFLRLVKEDALDEAIEIARSQIRAGAKVIDVNVDDAMLDSPMEMSRFLDRLASDAETASVPVMIDSSSWETISEGLQHLQGRGIVNSISLKEGEEEFIRRATHILRMGAAVVVMAMDEKGQADTLERKMEIVRRAHRILTGKVGFPPEAIIYDPNVLAVATGIEAHNSYGLSFIEASKAIKRDCKGAHVSGGISNLSFSFRGNDPVRKAMHAEFIKLASGLDMAIVNPSANLYPDAYPKELIEAVRAVLLDESPDAPRTLEDMAAEILASQPGKKVLPQSTPSDRPIAADNSCLLAEMIVGGRTEGMSSILEKEIEAGNSAMDIVDNSLMKGMDKVGALFGDGKMFLPQVVRSANAMKYAVEWLTPYITSGGHESISTPARPKAVIATVKGDVHDIGKNIVAIILRCNGFDVEDLGVMVPCESILSRVEESGADMVCLSGLITPSLQEMADVAREMERRGMKIPLYVGGAATTALHTAARIASEYSGPVFHTSDAASLPVVARAWLSLDTREATETTNRLRQTDLRNSLRSNAGKLVPYKEANLRAPVRPQVQSPLAQTIDEGVTDYYFSMDDVVPLINWRAFFSAWKLDASFASLAAIDGCDHCKAQWLASIEESKRPKASQAMQLHKEAVRMLSGMKEKLSATPLQARVAIGKAASRGNDIHVIIGSEEVRIPTLRSQTASGNAPLPAMADFVAESDTSYPDKVGFFTATVGAEVAKMIESYRDAGDEYSALLCQSLADRLAEATTELMHRRLTAGAGIRPAIGYQSLPDQSLVFEADKALHYSDFGISLTESGAMWPQASTTGLLLFSPEARYFTVGPISVEQAYDYARRRGKTQGDIRPFIGVRVM